jgi:hypothetical protein
MERVLAATQREFAQSVGKLIGKFESDKAFYLSKEYPEAQARIDFITPFFKALGLDVENEEETVAATSLVRDLPGVKSRVSGQEPSPLLAGADTGAVELHPKIAAGDAEIDNLVCGHCEVPDEERKIVEPGWVAFTAGHMEFR